MFYYAAQQCRPSTRLLHMIWHRVKFSSRKSTEKCAYPWPIDKEQKKANNLERGKRERENRFFPFSEKIKWIRKLSSR